MMSKKENEKYLVCYCTKNQFLKILKVLANTTGDEKEINMLVGDLDSHHQRKMALEMGILKKEEKTYKITELGEKLALAYDSDKEEFSKILREECLPRIPFFNSMLKLVKARKKLNKKELLKSIITLIGKGKKDSTYNSYINMAIGYLELGGVIRYTKKDKMINYIL